MNTQPHQRSEPSVIQRLAGLLNDRVFELILLPTEKCNFRCTYCYEDFELGRMTRETIEAIKRLLSRRVAGLERLQLSWFGGEPLVAKDIVLEISGFAAALVSEHPSLQYRSHMTTNAFLLDQPTFIDLAKTGVLDYQISLDGPEEVHNQTRRQANGAGTFDRIWNNLIAIRATSYPATIRLRVHYDTETAYRMDTLIHELKQQLLPDPRFSVVFHEIERLGGPNDAQIKAITHEENELAIAYLNRKLYGEDYSVPSAEPYVCYAAKANSLLVRSDGGIGKCTVALNDERNVIGKLNPDGTLTLDQSRVWPWLRGLETLDSDVLECPLANLPGEELRQPLVQLSR